MRLSIFLSVNFELIDKHKSFKYNINSFDDDDDNDDDDNDDDNDDEEEEDDDDVSILLNKFNA